MIKRIGVIGAGQMGSGIAHVCALKGFDIRLADVDQAHLDKGIEAIGHNMDRQIGRGMIRPEEKDSALKRIAPASDYKQFADCDLIVEAATENEAVKREIFKKVCEGLPPNVLLATNTSSISVTRLASVTDRPGKFMGMHFMNPVPTMGPLELADFIGLDTCLSVMQVLHEGLADSKYRPCPLLVKYVEAGWVGRKVKRGFYDYSGERPVPTR